MRYDIEASKFHVIGSWPRTPVIDRVELSVAPLGDLLLTGSSSLTKHVTGVVLRPSGDGVKVVGAFKRKGKLAIEPTLSPTVLTLPLVASPSGVDHVVIPAAEVFFEPKHKGKGKGNGKGKGKEDDDDDDAPKLGVGHCL